MNIDHTILEKYIESGRKLIPLRPESKLPSQKGWRTSNFQYDILKHKGNIGWAISQQHLVVDVDPLNGGTDSFIKLSQVACLGDIEPCVITPSGGYHYYLKIPNEFAGIKLHKNLVDYKGIDFLTEGSYCLIAGCYLNSNKREGYYQFNDPLEDILEYDVSPTLINLLSYKNEDETNDSFYDMVSGDRYDWSESRILKMLGKLDPSMNYNDWLLVGMGLHKWNTLDGLKLWRDWSSQSHKFDEDVLVKKWESFNNEGNVSLGSVDFLVKKVEFDDAENKVLLFLEKIKFSDEKIIKFDILPQICREKFDKIKKERLVKAIQCRLKEITGVKISISNVREMFQNYESDNNLAFEEIPIWCADWVYVNSHNGFMHLDTMKLHKSESFNIENGVFVPLNEKGNKLSATKYIADNGFVKKVSCMGYLPDVDELICEIDGTLILNTFNKRSIPQASDSYSPEGMLAIDRMRRHFSLICGDDEFLHKCMMEWISHQVQNPGKLVLWMFLIISIQGVGKSYIGRLLGAILGDINVGVVDPLQIVSNFNSWATGVLVNVLEDIKITGHSRYDAMNSLKPLITDSKIMINEKGIKQQVVKNTTNMIGFSNFKDAVPLDLDDRRFCPIFVNIESMEDLEEKVGMPVHIYHSILFEDLIKYKSEFRKYFEDYKISENFKNLKRAPKTRFRDMMVATEEEAHTGLGELRELINLGGDFYNKNVISSVDLFEDFSFQYPHINIENRQKTYLLKKLGYSLIPTPLKIGGKSRKFWSKTPIDGNKVREIFSKNDNNLNEDLL
ncbi:MAG: DUF5906 domain-containing protein [Sphaerospermopsis sp.]|nr:DUF5906 domain-containing protein [Sphaerospermopsis sp.]